MTINGVDESRRKASRVVGFVCLFAMTTSILAVGYVIGKPTASDHAAVTTPATSHPGGLTSAPIVYFEIAGPNGSDLKKFYSTVFGWSIDANFTIASSSTGGVRGGIRQDPAEKLIYLGVPSVVEALKQIESAGGKTIVPRTVVPGVVTFALFTDPAGNRLGLAEFGSFPR